MESTPSPETSFTYPDRHLLLIIHNFIDNDEEPKDARHPLLSHPQPALSAARRRVRFSTGAGGLTGNLIIQNSQQILFPGAPLRIQKEVYFTVTDQEVVPGSSRGNIVVDQVAIKELR